MRDSSPRSYRIFEARAFDWKTRNAIAKEEANGRRSTFFFLSPHLLFLPSRTPAAPFTGLANEKTVDVTAAPGGDGVAIRVSRPKNASKPAKATSTSISKKTSPRRVAASAGKAAASLRPDLKRAAAAKASALLRASRARKAASKGGAAAVAADE